MRLHDKIKEVEKYISELEGMLPHSFKEYQLDLKTKAACERYFEKIVEAIVDIAFLIIKENKYKTPEDDKEAFDILSQEKIISKITAEKLKDAKGMRNIIAHQYGVVDDEIVFEAITEQLIKDTTSFLVEVKQALKKE